MPELVGPKAPWVMLKWVNAYGPLFKMQFIDHLGVVLTDPDSIARVTRKSGMCIQCTDGIRHCCMLRDVAEMPQAEG